MKCTRAHATRVVSLAVEALADVRAFEALETDDCYIYGTLSAVRADVDEAATRRLLAHDAADGSLVRLDEIVERPGASPGATAAYRYVVETDVLAAHEADFNHWYDREHLPGLAGVPGTVRASRFRCPDGSPRYHACYDVVSPSVVGSPPWIVVRGTAWSQRVRPAFRNTTRTMFRRIAT